MADAEDGLRFRDASPHGDYAPGPWEYVDPESAPLGLGKFSEIAVYAAGNLFPWRMCEIQGPNEKCEIATARLIAAAPDLHAACADWIAYIDAPEGGEGDAAVEQRLLDAMRAAIAKVAAGAAA